jgi:hypothetical protein
VDRPSHARTRAAPAELLLDNPETAVLPEGRVMEVRNHARSSGDIQRTPNMHAVRRVDLQEP